MFPPFSLLVLVLEGFVMFCVQSRGVSVSCSITVYCRIKWKLLEPNPNQSRNQTSLSSDQERGSSKRTRRCLLRLQCSADMDWKDEAVTLGAEPVVGHMCQAGSAACDSDVWVGFLLHLLDPPARIWTSDRTFQRRHQVIRSFSWRADRKRRSHQTSRRSPNWCSWSRDDWELHRENISRR